MKWRIIPFSVHTGAMNMAIDEAVLEQVKSKQAPPTIRFYRWQPSAVSIGFFQSLSDEVNLHECKASGVDVIRRITGGGAVFHAYDGELTYSVIGPLELFPKNIIHSYEEICSWVIKGLSRLNIKARFVPINDIIAADGKKISGNAQTRRGNALLQHGTILYDVNIKKMFSLLKVPDEKIRDKMIKVAEERVTSILDFFDVPIEQAEEALLKGFVDGKDYALGSLKPEEKNMAARIAKTKYTTKEWNFQK